MLHARRKIDGPHESPMIHNVRGVGFIRRRGFTNTEIQQHLTQIGDGSAAITYQRAILAIRRRPSV